MIKVLVFDKYLAYNVGGAQQSLRTLIKGMVESDINFIYAGCEVEKSFGAGRNISDELPVEKFKIFEIPRFPYLEYFLNRKRVANAIKKYQADVLVTQGLWGAAAVNAFAGKSLYFIRDEYQLNRIPFYQRGIMKLLKLIYLFVQLPFVLILFNDNKKAIQKALTVANSQYLQKGIKDKFGKDARLVRSPIRPQSSSVGEESVLVGNYITCIGSEYMKGSEVVKRIASQMPDHNFMIVGREFKNLVNKGNLTFHPWVKDAKEIFKITKILLIPSICQESYPRVAIEAMGRGIPVLGSNNGGIPEVLEAKFIIQDLWNIGLWEEKIKEIERDYQFFSQEARTLSFGFDPQNEINNFKDILLSLARS